MLKTLRSVFLPLIMACLFMPSTWSQCVPVSTRGLEACIEGSADTPKLLKQLRHSDEGTPEQVFYAYFMAPDIDAYKSQFLASDWYHLTPEKFAQWKQFLKGTQIRLLGQFSFLAGNAELSILKYSYIQEDMEIYETFMVKKTTEGWKVVSAEEEQKYMNLANLVKYTQSSYLHQLVHNARSQTTIQGPHAIPDKIYVEKLIAAKMPLKVKDLNTYHERYNDDFMYTTDEKFKADRIQDPLFVVYLQEMKLSSGAQDTVMKLIYAQDYLNAAVVADHFSAETYTYSPFVDKIREIYGRDRIRKWDHINHKWD